MHLLDTYAINCGAKVDKPYLYESYFPLPVEKFITFQAQSKFESKDYSYWQDVLDMIVPFLSKAGISVLQIGVAGERLYNRVVDLRGKTNMNQLAYVMQRSLLHFGPDSFGVHLASGYDVPLVGLYSITKPEIAGPRFGTPSKQIIFDAALRVGNGKPSYQPKENPKSINTVKPEEIANAIFKLLGIEATIPFQTVFTGSKYGNVIREFIPNTPTTLGNPELPVEVRTDLFYDEKLLAHHLNYLQRAIIVVDKPINLNLIRHFKPHIAVVVYKITENDDPKWARELISTGANVLMVSDLPQDKIDPKKIDYYDCGTINLIPKPDEKTVEKLKADIDNLYFRTCKMIASGDKIYASHVSIDKGIELRAEFEYQKVIDDPKFWRDLDFFTIVKKLDSQPKS